MSGQSTITPGEFQEMCDQAVLTVGCQRWPADATPYDLSRTVIAEIDRRVSRHLGENYQDQHRPTLPNERWVEEIVEMVSRHWSSPVLVERTINEATKIVLEHWRERHLRETS